MPSNSIVEDLQRSGLTIEPRIIPATLPQPDPEPLNDEDEAENELSRPPLGRSSGGRGTRRGRPSPPGPPRRIMTAQEANSILMAEDAPDLASFQNIDVDVDELQCPPSVRVNVARRDVIKTRPPSDILKQLMEGEGGDASNGGRRLGESLRASRSANERRRLDSERAMRDSLRSAPHGRHASANLHEDLLPTSLPRPHRGPGNRGPGSVIQSETSAGSFVQKGPRGSKVRVEVGLDESESFRKALGALVREQDEEEREKRLQERKLKREIAQKELTLKRRRMMTRRLMGDDPAVSQAEDTSPASSSQGQVSASPVPLANMVKAMVSSAAEEARQAAYVNVSRPKIQIPELFTSPPLAEPSGLCEEEESLGMLSEDSSGGGGEVGYDFTRLDSERNRRRLLGKGVKRSAPSHRSLSEVHLGHIGQNPFETPHRTADHPSERPVPVSESPTLDLKSRASPECPGEGPRVKRPRVDLPNHLLVKVLDIVLHKILKERDLFAEIYKKDPVKMKAKAKQILRESGKRLLKDPDFIKLVLTAGKSSTTKEWDKSKLILITEKFRSRISRWMDEGLVQIAQPPETTLEEGVLKNTEDGEQIVPPQDSEAEVQIDRESS